MLLRTRHLHGAVYGAINRLVAKEPLRKCREETGGNRPPHHINYEITDKGREALTVLERAMLDSG